jgi:hypothetical protein
MLRRISVASVMAAVAIGASSATAAPQGGGLITESGFDCGTLGNPVTIVHSHGNNGWIDQDHYVVTSISFTDSEGTFSKTFGAKNGFGDPVTCSIVEDGTTVVVTAAQVP